MTRVEIKISLQNVARPPVTNFAGINLVNSALSHPLGNCRLYYSQVTVEPQKSIDYVQRNRILEFKKLFIILLLLTLIMI